MLSTNRPRPVAWLNLRHTVGERQAAFIAGLTRQGYSVRQGFPGRIGPRDAFCTWNRIGDGHAWANRFEAEGRPVLVAENAAWGNDFAGRRWYGIFPDFHNMLPRAPLPVDSNRFDRIDVELAPWKADGETLILPQRGIGPPQTAMPADWTRRALKRYGGRVRAHPGRTPELAIPFSQDLQSVSQAVTWGSGAAVKALVLGVSVLSDMPRWIAEQDNTDAGRLAMFRQLAMYQWTLDEIAYGEPFARLLK